VMHLPDSILDQTLTLTPITPQHHNVIGRTERSGQ